MLRVYLAYREIGEFETLQRYRAARARPWGRILTEKFGWQGDYVRLLSLRFVRIGEIVEPVDRVSVIADDPDHDRVLEAAQTAETGFIVSGGRHLLSLGRWGAVTLRSSRSSCVRHQGLEPRTCRSRAGSSASTAHRVRPPDPLWAGQTRRQGPLTSAAERSVSRIPSTFEGRSRRRACGSRPRRR
jgi:hypothetical protein